MAIFSVTAQVAHSKEKFTLPTPAPLPMSLPIPSWEKNFLLGDGLVPGKRMWVQNMLGNIWHYGTTQSVGGGTGMYVYAPPGGPSGYLCAYDTGVVREEKNGKVVRDDFNQFKGISLWIKGDGSAGTAIVSQGYSGSACKFRIPLKDTQWHKVFMPWDKWNKPVTGPFWFLAFGIERKDDSQPGWYIIDKVRLYKEMKSEEISPTPDNDPPGLLPAKAFVSGRRHITKTLAKLQAKKPVKIVVAGDSIVAGTQLWYTAKAWNLPESAMRYAYFERLGRSLMKHFGYSSVALPFRSFDSKKKEWTENPVPRTSADLTVMAVAAGGGAAQIGLDHIDQILKEKPDLVIWEYGCNDVTYGNLNSFLKATNESIRKLRAEGIEVIVQTITPGSDPTPCAWMNNKSPMEKAGYYNTELRAAISNKGCALADMEWAFLARGPQFTGDIYSDSVHPNHLGHEIMSDLLDALITDRDILIWKYGPVADSVRYREKKSLGDGPKK